MSLIQLDADTRQYRVVIPSCKRLPPNPHIGGPDALSCALVPPSETADTNSEWSPESRADKGLRHMLLANDQRSFFTGSAAADLQAAHIITAVRRNAERKRQVEAYLTQQRLHPPMLDSFFLDSISNAILLEANLHTQWDLYGTFCFVPTEDDANAMLQELRTCNETWRQRQHTLAGSASVIRAARPLDISKPPFSRPRWEIVVLHPHALLPDRQPLAIAQNRSLYVIGQPLPPTPSTWTFWIASGDRLFSLQQSDKYLDPFMATDVRGEFYILSSLAMVINAHCKLEQFMQDHGGSASERVKRFAQLISELVTEIFFVPQHGYVSVAALAHSQPESQDVPTTAGAVPSQPAPQAGQFSAAGNSHIVGPAADATMDAADPTVGDDGFGTVEAPEIPDADGMTDSEFRLVASKANDSHLDAKERANAAMMMIFGTSRYANPYVHEQASQYVHG
ncbi:hypothetical protein BDZ97DRAFT_1782429 [Flammula alnicola]|nr:hypothetical protein BDZ97DRAFT_1782429 [Flammula alnicola]